MSQSAKQLLQSLIRENPVLVLAKSYCPHCHRAKDVLREAGASAKIVDLDTRNDGADLQDAVKETFSHRTVPAIWINQKFIGGCDSLVSAQSNGTLRKMLDEIKK